MVFYFHFFISQHPRQTKNIPTKYTHLGIRHARSSPIPTAIKSRPHSQFVGAPLHLLRIPSPPFSIFMQRRGFSCKQKAQVIMTRDFFNLLNCRHLFSTVFPTIYGLFKRYLSAVSDYFLLFSFIMVRFQYANLSAASSLFNTAYSTELQPESRHREKLLLYANLEIISFWYLANFA